MSLSLRELLLTVFLPWEGGNTVAAAFFLGSGIKMRMSRWWRWQYNYNDYIAKRIFIWVQVDFGPICAVRLKTVGRLEESAASQSAVTTVSRYGGFLSPGGTPQMDGLMENPTKMDENWGVSTIFGTPPIYFWCGHRQGWRGRGAAGPPTLGTHPTWGDIGGFKLIVSVRKSAPHWQRAIVFLDQTINLWLLRGP